MDNITKVIASLGINQTLWVQLGIFLITYVLIKKIVFDPYFRAFEERQSKTVGSMGRAETLQAQTRELEAQYQKAARENSAGIKEIFDKSRSEAVLEQEKTLSAAREDSKDIVEKARARINDEISKVRVELLKEAPVLSQTIADRLLINKGDRA